jgi:hypothetical protein
MMGIGRTRLYEELKAGKLTAKKATWTIPLE